MDNTKLEDRPIVTGQTVSATSGHVTQAKKPSLKLAIILMVWPAIAVVGSIILYAVLNLVFSSAPPANGELFADRSPVQAIGNVMLFVVGAAGVGLGPFSFIAGIVLLVIRLQKSN